MATFRRTPPRITALPASLTAEQRAAVESSARLVTVVGGPGTGKTTVACEIVRHGVEVAGFAPGNCLIVASSRVAAAELRATITTRLGATTTQPLARTLPALAFGVLRRAAALRGDPSPRLLSGPEQDVVLRELLAGHRDGDGRAPLWPSSLAEAVATRGFRDELRELLMRCTERGLVAADLRDLGWRHDVPEWVAAAAVLAEYEQVTALAQPGAYDPASILGAALSELENDPTALAGLVDELRLLVVDDAQEMTPPGAALVATLLRAGCRVVLLGDPDVATQTFRGADPAAFLTLRAPLGAPTETVILTRSLRHGPQLQGVLDRVAEHIGSSGGVSHRRPRADGSSEATPSGSVEVSVTSTAAQESHLVTERLRRLHLLHGVPWSRMAVITRGASRTATLRRELAGAGVPVTVPGAAVPLREEAAVAPMLTLLALAVSRAAGEDRLDASTALDLLTSPLGGADPSQVRALRRALRRLEAARDGSRTGDELLVASLLGDPLLTEAGAVGGGARRLARALAAGVAEMSSPACTAETVLWTLWSAMSLSDSWRATAVRGGPRGTRADRDLDAMVALFGAAAAYVDRLPGRGPEGFLEHALGQDVAGDSLVPRAPDHDAVTLTTPSGAVAREWDVVVVSGVADGVWPDPRVRGTLLRSAHLVDVVTGRSGSRRAAQAAVLHDETRLFLLAVSRATRHLLVTAVRNDEEQPSVLLDVVDPRDPDDDAPRALSLSPQPLSLPGVVAQRRRELASPHATDTVRDEAARVLASLASLGVPGAHPDTWWDDIALSTGAPRRSLEEPLRVSPSSLDTFTACPLRWMFDASGGRPAEGRQASSVGTLVHDIVATTDPSDLAALQARLEERWPELGLPDGWLGAREKERAAGMLGRVSRYTQAAQSQGWDVVDREIDIDVVVGRAAIRGRVDWVERDADGRLRVIDLKTGTSRPTKAELTRHPQLGVYQVAVGHGALGGEQVCAGAALLQVGKDAPAQGALLGQAALADDPDPSWAEALLDSAVEGMAAANFTARPGGACRTCSGAACCPARPEGGRL
jgi:superfamily I DNA/RNA helicase/RecB family exonuclease